MLTSDLQGICLVSEDGRHHMCSFDELPRLARVRLRNSPFNLCASCVVGRGQSIGYGQAIIEMENTVRALIAANQLKHAVQDTVPAIGPKPANGGFLTVSRPDKKIRSKPKPKSAEPPPWRKLDSRTPLAPKRGKKK
jgi:hypothetical protein